MKKYEITFITRPDIDEKAQEQIFKDMKKVLTDKKAKIEEEKAIGQKELAYEMNKFNTGFYYSLVVEASSEAVSEFDRIAKLNENIIRSLIIKVEK